MWGCEGGCGWRRDVWSSGAVVLLLKKGQQMSAGVTQDLKSPSVPCRCPLPCTLLNWWCHQPRWCHLLWWHRQPCWCHQPHGGT